MTRRKQLPESPNRTRRADSEAWIRDGWAMASHEDEGALESIEIAHEAETKEHFVHAEEVKAQGAIILERRNALQEKLTTLQFDRGAYNATVARGRIDLYCAIGLAILNATIGIFVFSALGPVWMALLLSFLVMATAIPVEEFFQSYDEQAVLREGIFLVLALTALSAQFYLGSIRGLFLTAVTPVASGPVSEFFHNAAPILRYGLGILAAIIECLCGYKFHQARTQLCSTAVRTAREHAKCDASLVAFHRRLEEVNAEPDIRRSYRTIGARQFLASKDRLKKRLAERHLARAAFGAVIAIGVIVLLLFCVPGLVAATPEGRVNVALVDLSRSVPQTEFDSNLAALAPLIEKMGAGERIVIVGIADGFGNTPFLFDRSLPADAGFMDLQLASAREQIVAEWKATAKLVRERPRFNDTDILGAIRFLSYLGIPMTPRTRFFIFSDMRQSTKDLDLERASEINAETTMAKVKRMNQVVPIPGVRVYLLGINVHGTTDRYFVSLKTFWMNYFKAAGAEVRAFAVNRTIPAW